MELYQLKTFVKVADTGNLTRAAEALFTSQPAISAQIKALEEELKLQLFDRTPKGMTLTNAGKILYSHANETLIAAEKVKHEALQLQNELVGELKAGMHTDFDFMRAGKMYAAFQQQHPKVTLHFLQTSSYQVIRQLRTGELDVGFMFGSETAKDMHKVNICNVPMKVVAPACFADAVEQADINQLVTLPWIYTSPSCPFYRLSEAIFTEVHPPANKVAWADTENAVRELVTSGVGLSILRADDAENLKHLGKAAIWEGNVPNIDLSFVCSKKRANEPLIKAFFDTVLSQWNQDNTAHPLTVNA